MKNKTVIFTLAALAFVLLFAGCAKPNQLNNINNKNELKETLDNHTSDDANQMTDDEKFVAENEYIPGATTFEEFCVGMKDDLSQEILEELQDLYEEYIQAELDGDANAMTEIYEMLVDMDVLTMEENYSTYGFRQMP